MKQLTIFSTFSKFSKLSSSLTMREYVYSLVMKIKDAFEAVFGGELCSVTVENKSIEL